MLQVGSGGDLLASTLTLCDLRTLLSDTGFSICLTEEKFIIRNEHIFEINNVLTQTETGSRFYVSPSREVISTDSPRFSWQTAAL
jgi:hypothetical protein